MLLFRLKNLCFDIQEGGAQFCCDTHIVAGFKGDLGDLSPKGHPEAFRANDGDPSPIANMEHRCQLTQLSYLVVIRQSLLAYQSGVCSGFLC